MGLCDVAAERADVARAGYSSSLGSHTRVSRFSRPLLCPDTTLHIYGSGERGESIAEAFDRFIAPPFFPIRTADLPATIKFHDVCDSDFAVGLASVMSRPVPHVGPTNGYRLNLHGFSIAYIPDHQEPIHDPSHVDEAVLELCDWCGPADSRRATMAR